MLSVDWVTNIPTPYRNHLHERMAEIFPRHGLDVTVHFMAWSEPDRHWQFEPADLAYPHRVHRGIHPRLGSIDLHFNPGLLAGLARSPADVLVVGGWFSPSHILAPYLAGRLAGSRPFRFLYSESHALSVKRHSGPAHALKSRIVARYDGYIVPGDPQRAYLELLDPAAVRRPFVKLPNLIDEAIYVERVGVERGRREALRRSLDVADDRQLWLCPARLEPFKGLDRFVPLLRGIEGVDLLVAGDGSLRGALEERVRREALPVRLLGACDQDTMLRLYAAADLFVLPSLQDPCPLSPIEACAAGLPLLVSRRIGNLHEVCEEGGNGWTLDPEAPGETAATLREIAGQTRAALAARGERAAAIYRDRFDTDRCVERLATGMRDAVAVRSRP
jgi:glycosyltransferase involved in cell wall biosynthesis